MAIPIQEVAKRVIAESDRGDREVFIDPATIMLICSILSAVFNAARLYCEWKNGQSQADGMREVCMRPTFRQRRMVMNQIAHADTERRLGYGQRRRLCEYIFKAGRNASPEDLQKIIDSEADGWYGEWLV